MMAYFLGRYCSKKKSQDQQKGERIILIKLTG